MTRASQLAAFMLRDLGAVRRELEAYPEDALVWALPPGAPNSAGTLALHVAGNLRHYVGACLGQTGYVRDRPREFSARALPRTELLAAIADAEAVVARVLPGLDDAALQRPYPEAVAGNTVQTEGLLAHLCTHLAYHLGQIDYHRRIVTGQADGVGAISHDVIG